MEVQAVRVTVTVEHVVIDDSGVEVRKSESASARTFRVDTASRQHQLGLNIDTAARRWLEDGCPDRGRKEHRL